jgi:hypothetical protein
MDHVIGSKTIVGVIGSSIASGRHYDDALKVGELIALRNAITLTGGMGGVMEAASKGAKSIGGTTVGVLPSYDARDGNPYIDIPIVTGLNHARNIIVVRSSHVIIAVGGEYGTLSEIAFALKLGMTVVGLDSWDVGEGIVKVETPDEAVEAAFEAIR